MEKVINRNIHGSVQKEYGKEYSTAKDWLNRIIGAGSSSDSLVITWTLNQYSRDSLYTMVHTSIANHFERLSEYDQNNLYLHSMAIDIFEGEERIHFLFNNHPNLARVKVKELVNETR
ncbi:MAG: hypothetical protein L3J12_10165 [Spirochaetales bacterium]|nr:hypothetical protein [Spirochaetales bacterium]